MARKILAQTRVHIDGTGTEPVTLWTNQAEKATPKLNALYKGLVDFVANEFSSGTRTI